MQWVEDHIRICNVIKEKAKKYGELNLQFIIAINVLSYFCREIHIVDALFGEKKIIEVRQPRGRKLLQTRKLSNGAWIKKGKPQYTRISGALTFVNLGLMNIAKQTPVLWHNPWTKHPLEQNILPLFQKMYNKQSDLFELKKGVGARDIFDIPENWPIIDNIEEGSKFLDG